MATTPAGPTRRFVHYVPGEVCVVVEAERVDDLAGWYGTVRDSLNGALKGLLAHPPSRDDLSPAVRQDLDPKLLQAAFDRQPAILQALSRGDAKVLPWAPLPGLDAPAGLLFYQIGTAGDNAGAALSERLEWVRELTNLVNSGPHLPITDQAGKTARVAAVTPNWLSAGTPAETTGGGPGSYPLPAPGGRWDFHFPDRALEATIAAARERREPSGVTVAVLDTCPDWQAVRRKAASLEPPDPRHPLNRIVAPGGQSAPWIELDGTVDGRFQHLQGYIANWNQPPGDGAEDEPRFVMADHGLFVAGIIKNIAPRAKVRITRVLNDCGVGDLHALTTALATLALEQTSEGYRQRRLVINLSLMVDQPARDELFRLLWPNAARVSPDALKPADKTVIDATLDAADAALIRAVGALPAGNTLIVAAAGNDNDVTRDPPRPEPRLPARYDASDGMPNVVGVAALTADRKPADFSNMANVDENPRGIAAFGGNAARQPSGPSKIERDRRGKEDAVVGLFSAEALPITGEPNKSGWVYWAGTSFATPIISGIAADLWTTDRNAENTVAMVRAYATVAENDLRSHGIPAHQRR